jgi:hypothetical protein
LEMEEMRERDERFPRESVRFCVLVPMNLGGAKNLTVKSILWRGSAYRFPSLSVHSHKKERKKSGGRETCMELLEEAVG